MFSFWICLHYVRRAVEVNAPVTKRELDGGGKVKNEWLTEMWRGEIYWRGNWCNQTSILSILICSDFFSDARILYLMSAHRAKCDTDEPLTNLSSAWISPERSNVFLILKEKLLNAIQPCQCHVKAIDRKQNIKKDRVFVCGILLCSIWPNFQKKQKQYPLF